LHRGFTFDDAAALADYLVELGVSHAYLSPILEAVSGSVHGYDVIDPTVVDGDRGGEEGFARLVERAHEVGLGLVVDVVPNHLAVNPSNQWWWDLLENGPLSRWAHVFDVDWMAAPGEETDARVLLPVLGDHYGRVLERGEIRLAREGGSFVFCYFEHRFPVSPRSLGAPLARAARSCGSETLAFVADALSALPAAERVSPEAAARRDRDKRQLQRLLLELLDRDPEVQAAVDREIDALHHDFDRLDELHQRQNYRLSHWRLAGTQLNYRRFFDINSLVGIRVELLQVFDERHARLIDMVRSGVVDGLRIDHPDGLRDPTGYMQRLAEVAPEAWIVVEKILEPDEVLPSEWPVAGTTGYDFLNLVQGLFVDPRGGLPLAETYRVFTREDRMAAGEADVERYDDLVFDRKLAVCRELLAGDVTRLVQLLREVCDARRRMRDFTRRELRTLIETLAAAWPVYRTYVRTPATGWIKPPPIDAADAEVIREAVVTAAKREPSLDPELLQLFERLMTLRESLAPGDASPSPEHEFVLRFQQLTGPVMAKGVEDTVFYRYFPLLALNEVGGDPSRFGSDLRTFHAELARRAEQAPASMLATSTHDTKRSEDVRARLCVLSEMPDTWNEAVERWATLNDERRRAQPVLLDRNTEYLLYQTLVGAWPPREPDGGLPADWSDRVSAYALKAAREAKLRTSWLSPDQAYEAALDHFVRGMLGDPELVADIEAFVAKVRRPGWINSLAQTLIKLTAPGAGDIYQGCELWDLSLVDPDNRRPVDFERRRAALTELRDLTPDQVWSRWPEGLPKLWTIRRALELRRQRPELFEGPPTPLELRGTPADVPIAFARGSDLAVVAMRWSTLIESATWAEAQLTLPTSNGSSRWRDVLSDAVYTESSIPLATVWAMAPVALLVREPAGVG
jgi:(1->4)-alpha-D-glucan 1-alpha-D-glucosylmutase